MREIHTVFDYVDWRGDLTFAQDPFNEVDSVILSMVCFLDFSEIVPGPHESGSITLRDAMAQMPREFEGERRLGAILPDDILYMSHLAAESVRYGDAELFAFENTIDEEKEMQFGALTFRLSDGSLFAAFRGTDDTIVGWKEDFNMTFRESIPAQLLAAQYTKEISERYPMHLYMGGHSKGGNLAVYSAVKSDALIRSRIQAVYNHDGPGFTDFVMEDPAYLEMVPRISTIIPQSSVIGMLLEHREPYTVVKSKQMGLLQHDFYSWLLEGPEFVPMEEVTDQSKFLDLTIKEWLNGMTIEERNEIVDTVFDLLSIGNVSSVFDLIHPKNVRTYLKTLTTNGELRRILSEEFMSLIEAARKTQMTLEGKDLQSPGLPDVMV